MHSLASSNWLPLCFAHRLLAKWSRRIASAVFTGRAFFCLDRRPTFPMSNLPNVQPSACAKFRSIKGAQWFFRQSVYNTRFYLRENINFYIGTQQNEPNVLAKTDPN